MAPRAVLLIRVSILCLVGMTSAALGRAAPGAVSTTPAAAPAMTLAAARNGDEILLSWEIPRLDIDIRQIELMRHTRREQKGRSRVATVHARHGLYTDRVPDPSAAYWYWLKITLADGLILGVGPVQTPSASVWQPSP